MTDTFNSSKALTIVLGIIGTTLTMGLAALVAMLLGMGDRLSRIETTIGENREIRERQDADIMRRVERIEGDLYERRFNGDER